MTQADYLRTPFQPARALADGMSLRGPQACVALQFRRVLVVAARGVVLDAGVGLVPL